MSEKQATVRHLPEEKERFELTERTKLFPKMVVLNTCYPCNAKCPHCPYTNSNIRQEKRSKENPYVGWEVFKAIADQVGEHRATLRISAAGEPLLHPKVVEFVEYAKSVGCEVGIITNGSLMNEEKATRFIQCGVEMIEFSVDAADPVTYQVVRKGLQFERTVENIRRTIDIRNRLKGKTSIIASVVNQKLVADKIDSIVAFWEKIVDTVQVRKYLTWDINDLENSGDITPYLVKEAPCPFPFDRFLIDTNGDMRFCVYDIKGRTNWGNVLKESISSVWSGSNFNHLRNLQNSREFHKMPICEKCLDRQFRSWNYNYFHLRDKAAKEAQSRSEDQV
ncbi:MAG: radical SAM protein [Candidatus Omnitrophica bacterium]|nr:radical SAM protein [Candidatus Omnitrophota bacterium]